MLGQLVGGFVTILVGVTLMPTVANEVVGATNATNVTGASKTITELVPLFYALGVVSAGIAIAAVGLRQAGILGV